VSEDEREAEETPSPADVARQSSVRRRRRRRRAAEQAREVSHEIGQRRDDVTAAAGRAVHKTTEALEETVDEVIEDVRHAASRIRGRPAADSRRTPEAAGGTSGALRSLTGGGGSKVGTQRAMRARDAARPMPDDLAQAERSVVIVRRSRARRDPD
jgi:hypothetical protein